MPHQSSLSPVTARDRFTAMLEHREADRVPIAFGGPSCSIHREAHANLLEYLGFPMFEQAPVIDTILQIVEPDQRLCQHFDIDVLWLIPDEGPVSWEAGRHEYVDELGRRFKLGGGFFNQVAAPLKAGTPDELARYQFPDLANDNRAAKLVGKGQRLYDAGYGLVVDGPWGLYEYCSSLRGSSEFFMDMALNPEYVEDLAERVLVEYLIPFYTLMLKEVGSLVQMVGISDDYGSQTGLLFSPAVFRTVFKPRLKRLVEHIRTMTAAKIYIHSDGAVSDIIPDFIEIGIDGLNPVQYTAKGMQADKLKREYGSDLGFFGGGIENEILSYGTIEEIRRDMQQQVSALAPGGGFLLATIHNISPEVPPDNIQAFFEAGLEFGRYPIR